MARSTVGDYFWQRLKKWCVHRVYGYPGDGINGLMGALHRAESDFDLCSRPARGDVGLHGHRARKVYR